jgi:hypothetical protein
MLGAAPPLPKYTFMAWCSVKKKAQGQLKFYLKLMRRLGYFDRVTPEPFKITR